MNGRQTYSISGDTLALEALETLQEVVGILEYVSERMLWFFRERFTCLDVLAEEVPSVDATAVLHPPRLRNYKRATEHTEIASI